jgi:4-amino-4-deoxychorismate lyase
MLAVLVNGIEGVNPAQAIAVNDRGLSYGDGVFETMTLRRGGVRLLDAHLARLARGCERLGFDPPHQAQLRSEIDRVCRGAQEGIVKVIVTRGIGARGYRASADASPTRIVSLHGAVPRSDSVRVRWCDMRWSRSAALAGIKHLNRLEQVLAQNEWNDPNIGEGLMLDSEGELISATAANVFIVRGLEISTPDLRYCGIRGVLRDEVIRRAQELGLVCHEEPLWPEDLEGANEVFVTNAVRGIRAVVGLEQHTWPIGPVTERLMKAMDDDA